MVWPTIMELNGLTRNSTAWATSDGSVSRPAGVRRALSSDGHTVYTADDGTEALKILDVHGAAIGIIVTDLDMPGLDGISLAREARARHPGVAIVFMTAFSDQLDRIKSGKAQQLVLGQYRVLDVIGEGGFGQVFKAVHGIMNRLAAIKIIARVLSALMIEPWRA